MKKFLSLVLSLVMTMSLVTISAGATEYKDLTDKGEIQYEEAVAVLNKIGIITGYEDGSFKPTGALTRGAAAKIIVSLMIGPEAAGALSVNAAPYKDVPVTNTFASVISYCKTAGYINGYGDNTFRPADPLTGYAFAKMLLGALGYDGTKENFTGSGWTMNVARVGNLAGLYNDFIDAFQGNKAVTREQAAQLALNTLKATNVEYRGQNVSVSGPGINVDVGNTMSNPVARTESNAQSWNNNADGELQFVEEHFPALKKINGTTSTTYGRPASQWSYKNVTVGKFAILPNYTFTTGGTGDTTTDELKSLGLGDYKIKVGGADATKVFINSDNATTLALEASTGVYDVTSTTADADSGSTLKGGSVAERLNNLFGNGVVVEIYMDEDTEDLISDIVVIRSQLMEVNTSSAKTVTVKQLDEVGNDTYAATATLFNTAISSIKEDSDVFASVKDFKVGDLAQVTYADGKATAVAAPTVVTGALTGITTDKTGICNGVIVGGTTYKLAAVKDDDFAGLTPAAVSATKKDVTLYLDAYGYATYIKDQGTSTEFFIYAGNGSTYDDTNKRVLNTVLGFDLEGNQIELNIGNAQNPTTAGTAYFGDILTYTNSGASARADYVVSKVAYAAAVGDDTPGWKSAGALALKPSTTAVNGNTIGSGVKTFFITWDGTMSYAGQNSNTSVEVKNVTKINGVANTSVAEMTNSQMYVDKNGAVKAIVIMDVSKSAVSEKTLFVEKYKAYDGASKLYTYGVFIDGASEDIQSTDNIPNGTFATYAETSEGKYTLRQVKAENAATASFTVKVNPGQGLGIPYANNNLIYNLATSAKIYDEADADVTSNFTTAGNYATAAITELNLSGAKWIDLTENGLVSGKALATFGNYPAGKPCVELRIVMNNVKDGENQFKISEVIVVDFIPSV